MKGMRFQLILGYHPMRGIPVTFFYLLMVRAVTVAVADPDRRPHPGLGPPCPTRRHRQAQCAFPVTHDADPHLHRRRPQPGRPGPVLRSRPASGSDH